MTPISEERALHPVYVALDNQQYKTAIKLCSNIPSFLGQALLAHSYFKNGNRQTALSILYGLLEFPELQLELLFGAPEEQVVTPQTTTSNTASSKKGKKGKKKPTPRAAAPAVSASVTYSHPEDWDWTDRLDAPPQLPEKWFESFPSKLVPESTLLATLSMTLTQLGCLLSVHCLYVWASNVQNDVQYLKKAYLSGLAVIVQPRYQTIQNHILKTLQNISLKLKQVQFPPSEFVPAGLWAAQTSLWQYQIDTRNEMVMRLAESFASKSLSEYRLLENSEAKSVLLIETFNIYLQTLDIQKKYNLKLELIDSELNDSESVVSKQTLLEQKASTLRQLERHTDARLVIQELLETHPDDWEYWQCHREVSTLEANGDTEDSCQATCDFIEHILSSRTGPYPLRGPHLMKVAIASTQISSTGLLYDQIKHYATEFAPRSSSTYSDLHMFLKGFLEKCSVDEARQLIALSDTLCDTSPGNSDPKERQKELRRYIFGVQLCFRVVAQFPELDELLPSWPDLVKIWTSFRDFEILNSVNQEQKEGRPPDELMLLAVQRLLYKSPSVQEMIVSACLLDASMKYSPHSSYLKIESMFVNGELHAASRSWDVYNELYIKHIQNESCSYLILPILRSGGHYREVITVCQGILGLHRSSERETADYAGKAIERGSASKANEFIEFHCKKMRASLVLLEAKGLILDSAPFINHDESGELGLEHGIVGRDTDLERATRMTVEAHNANGAFSLLQIQSNQKLDDFSDNRDLDILSHSILQRKTIDSPERILSESIRRGKVHGLLIRASLCVAATKGPKKGKIAGSSPELRKRCLGLLSVADEASQLCDKQPGGYNEWVSLMVEICRVIAALGAGMDASSNESLVTLEAREDAGVAMLGKACWELRAVKAKLSELDLSVGFVSRILSDCIAPSFAMFLMCAKVADLFGWGPRKRKTKRVATVVADLALLMFGVLEDMKPCLEDLSCDDLPIAQGVVDELGKLIGASSIKESVSSITKSRAQTRQRVEVFLEYVKSTLKTFVVEG